MVDTLPAAPRSQLHWLLLLIGLALIRGLFYLSLFPPFLAPDESAHFEAIRLLGQEKKWPTAEVYQSTPMHPQMVATFENFRIWQLVGLYSPTRSLGLSSNLFVDYYPTQIAGSEVIANAYLMLYHLTLSPLAALLAGLDLSTQVYLLRVISVLFAAGTVVAVWLTVRAIFPTDDSLALAVGVFVVFWPMHTHVDASVTVDALVELFACLVFLMLGYLYLKGWSWPKAIILMGLVGLAILTKPTALFLLPTLAAAGVIYLARRLRWPSWASATMLSGLIFFTFIGALLVHRSSEGGRKILSLAILTVSIPDWTNYMSAEAFTRYVGALNFAVLSFAGLFGWSNIHIPWLWVRLWAVFLVIIALGAAIFIFQNLMQNKLRLSDRQRRLLLIWLCALIFAGIGVITPIIVTQSSAWGIHSRYYFPVIIPLAVYFFTGFRQLFPGSFRRYALPAWIFGWIAYDSLVLLWVVIPYLYG